MTETQPVASEPVLRLDVWLARERGITRHAAQTMIDAGMVTVNGRPGRSGQRIRSRDIVSVATAEGGLGTDRGDRYPDPVVPRYPSQVPLRRALRIVYEDEWLAVVDKPAGLVVHPAAGHPDGTLADALRARGTTWSLLGGEERAGIVHRLDRDTSGLLVVAKTEAAHRSLAEQLRTRTLGRTYWAMAHGGFREDTGSIEAPIGRHARDRKRMAVIDGGREAATDFRVIERLGDVSVLEVTLRTGRTHQIRVHLAYIKHPVVGDAAYGRAEPQLGRPALHATRLTFSHPKDGVVQAFESPLPAELTDFLEQRRAKHR